MYALLHLFVEEQLHEKEYAQARDTIRASAMRLLNDDDVDYDSYESYGSPNDNSHQPLPELTPETEHGYLGLDPPLN